MKSLKLSLLAASLAFVAGAAHATIADGQGGNGELFLSVYDATAQMSFVKDLGLSVNSFAPTTGSAAANQSFSFGADANWTAFTAAITASGDSLSNAVYNIVGVDTLGAASAQQILVSSNATQATIAKTTNNKVTNIGAAVNLYLGAVNTLPAAQSSHGSAVSINGSSYAGAGDGQAYWGGGVFGSNLGGQVGFDDSAAVGSTVNFFQLKTSSVSAIKPLTATQFGLAGQPAATWKLDSTGTLTYAVAPVPEPGSWAMMLAGLVAVGAIARRRLS